MGYQVGNVCYTTKKEAENVYFSKVVPVIAADGKLHHPIYQDAWYYNGRILQISLPECEPLDNFKLGFELGFYFISIFIVLFVFDLIKKILIKAV